MSACTKSSSLILLKELKKLEKHELRIRDFVENHMVDQDGMVLSFLCKKTLKPWTNDQLKQFCGGLKVFEPSARGDMAGVLAYEDSLMATSEYGLSQIYRYKLEKQPEALASASQQVFALLQVFYEGESFERGYLPKPHGGMRKAALSHEISPDQQIKALATLRAYEAYASPSLIKRIHHNLVALADYHIVRNFMHPRRECFIVTPENRPHHLSVLIPSLWIAYRITGKKSYLQHLLRFDSLLDDLAQGKNLFCDYNPASLYIEGFHLAMQEGLKDQRLTEIIRRLWEGSVQQITADGQGYLSDRRISKTSRVLRLPSYAPIVDFYFPEIEAWRKALLVLERLDDPRKMLYVDPPVSAKALQEIKNTYHEVGSQSICETSVTSWLLAYWRLRAAWGKNNALV